MRKILLALILTTSFYCHCQKIMINSSNNSLNLKKLIDQTNTYLVYFQDSINGPKYNMELWERSIKKNKDLGEIHFSWNRFFSNGSYYTYKIRVDARNFNPIDEQILLRRNNKNLKQVDRRYFIYENGILYTHNNPSLHNGKTFRVNNIGNSLNWEMDMETFSMLPLKEGRDFSINFYHPGSTVSPKYYSYRVVRSESIIINSQVYDCWVLKIKYPGHGQSEFWVDKKSLRTLKMKEFYDGKYRFKKLVV